MKRILTLTLVLFQISLQAQTPLTANAGPDQAICVGINSGIDTTLIGGQPSSTGAFLPTPIRGALSIRIILEVQRMLLIF